MKQTWYEVEVDLGKDRIVVDVFNSLEEAEFCSELLKNKGYAVSLKSVLA